MSDDATPGNVPLSDGLGLRWAEAPRRTEYGAGMMEALVALGKDHTLRLYAEEEALPLVLPSLLHVANSTAVEDVKVLEAAVAVMSHALDELVTACTENGKPKAPDRADLMRARAMLPPRFQNAFKKA